MSSYFAINDWTPRTKSTKALLGYCAEVLETYSAQGYRLTLRQLYYQMVSRGYLPNTMRDYKNLGELVKNAREGGQLSWDHIEDRGRVLVSPSQWASASVLMNQAASQFRLDRWEGQDNYVEVWVEKDAVAGIIEPVADRWHVKFMANRGYSSASAMYSAAQRLAGQVAHGKVAHVLYLGDHDPSGLDMDQDMEGRLHQYSGEILDYDTLEITRLALTMDQVKEHQPPPNPTKTADSRAESYIDEFGTECWELDALDPATLDSLVDDAIEDRIDLGLFEERKGAEEAGRASIRAYAEWLETQE